MSFWQRLTHGGWTVRHDADWPTFAGPNWLTNILTVPVTDRHHAKQGRSIGRWKLIADGCELTVYLKRHFRHSLTRGLRSLLWPGRSDALTEARHLAHAQSLGVPVPRTVAAGELAGPYGQLQGFIALEELPDMLPLHELIPLAAAALAPLAFAHWKRGLIAEMVRLTHLLHEASCFHKDLYLCHFYAPASFARRLPTAWTGQLFMIDFHRFGRHPLTGPWWLAKDLGQLLYSTHNVVGVTDRDRLRFARLYRGTRGRSLLQRLLEALARQRGRNYRRHALARRLKRAG